MQWEILQGLFTTNAVIVLSLAVGAGAIWGFVLALIKLAGQGRKLPIIGLIMLYLLAMILACTWYDYQRELEHQRWEQNHEQCSKR